LAGERLRRDRQELPRTPRAGKRRPPRHRQQRRSAGAPDGQGRGRAAQAGPGTGDAGLARSGDQRSAQMKLLRTIRLDPSDTFVFERAAVPGEWAVPGAFVFWDSNPAELEGKARAAFRAGFLGISSLGHSTLVQIVEASEEHHRQAVEILSERLVTHFGAPDLAAARKAATEEIAFASSLCTHPPDTLIAMHRAHEDGGTREAVRPLRPRR